MRERLIKLLGCKYNCVDRNKCLEEQADYLIENDAIVPPVKIGQTVYEIQQDRTLHKWYVYGIIRYDGQEWAAKAKKK